MRARARAQAILRALAGAGTVGFELVLAASRRVAAPPTMPRRPCAPPSCALRRRYKSAYELGGEPRATAVMRNYFAQQQVDAGAPASADDGAPAAAESAAGGASSAAPAAPAVQASAPSAGGAAASDAELVRIEPAPLSERKGGKLLVAGSAAWEDVRAPDAPRVAPPRARARGGHGFAGTPLLFARSARPRRRARGTPHCARARARCGTHARPGCAGARPHAMRTRGAGRSASARSAWKTRSSSHPSTQCCPA